MALLLTQALFDDFSWYCTIPVLLAFANKVTKGWDLQRIRQIWLFYDSLSNISSFNTSFGCFAVMWLGEAGYDDRNPCTIPLRILWATILWFIFDCLLYKLGF
jgi:hypothetical protein